MFAPPTEIKLPSSRSRGGAGRHRGSALVLVLAASLFCQTAAAQMMAGCGADQLDVRYDSNNGCAGNFFDVEATGGSDVNLESFAGNFDGTVDVEIWTRPGTHVGFEGAATGWTMIGSALGIVSSGVDQATPLPIPIGITLLSGTRQAFLVLTANGNFINYTNGAAVGAVSNSDTFLTVYEGTGICAPGPWGSPISVRNWNGTICYNTGCSGACSNPIDLMLATSGLSPAQSATGTLTVDSTICTVDDVSISCQGVAGDEVVLRFTAPFQGSAAIDTCGAATSFDTAIAVFESDCAGLELACNDDGCGTSSRVTLDVMSGVTYVIVVEGAMAATGQAEVTLYMSEGITCTAAAPPGTGMMDIPITVDLDGPMGSLADLDFEYSVDAGATWQVATPAAGSLLANPALAVPAPSTGNVFTWDSLGDMVGLGSIDIVDFRVTVTDSVTAGTGTCQTAPFDVMNQLCGGICGDCDTNGMGPTIVDALFAAQIAAGILAPTPSQAACCDVNALMPGAPPNVDVVDALLMAQSSAGLPVQLNCP